MSMKLQTASLDHILLRGEFPGFTPLLLFEHWTTPVLITKWWAEAAEIDPRPEGKYRLSFNGGKQHLRGKYTDVQPGEALAFTWKWEHEPAMPEREVVLNFTAQDKGALLTLWQGTYGATEPELQERQSHVEGWQHFLNRLEQMAVGG